MAPICGICHQQESKYRCPTCDLRYCSLVCYQPHKANHKAEGQLLAQQHPAQPKRDRPGTIQRTRKVAFTGFDNDKDFQSLLARYPSLKTQLGIVYGLTLEPGLDDARAWNRQPLPGSNMPPAPGVRGRGRGRGRGFRDGRGGRSRSEAWRDERERGAWTREKGDNEALKVIKKMRGGSGESDDTADGMREFIDLCRIKFTGQNREN